MCTLHLQWSSSAPWVFELAFDHQPVRLATKDLACCDSQKLGGSRNKWSSPGDKLPIKKTPTVKNHWDLTLIGWGRGTWCWKKNAPPCTSFFSIWFVPTFHVMRSSKASWENRVSKSTLLFGRHCGILHSLLPLSSAIIFLELRLWQPLEAHNSLETKRRTSPKPRKNCYSILPHQVLVSRVLGKSHHVTSSAD